MGFSCSKAIRPSTALSCVLLAVACLARADDYVRDRVPSAAAKAHFAAVPEGLPSLAVAMGKPQDRGEGDAYYTDDGAISIPPGAMVGFSLSGKCMDPHLPAPAPGEPMQFVNVEKLVPPKLRPMYRNLVARMAMGDPEVLANNPQHLVWAIRTAGTDDPLANSLSDEQLAVLDACAGRSGAFLRFHEKEKRRNARRRRKGGPAATNRVTVGDLSYDASELSGTNGTRIVESHMTTLTEMGRKSTVRTSEDFRYGEIEEEFYSDIVCKGGLAFQARILNASEHRREFLALDFAAQVGNGDKGGSRRQRVTMVPPAEFVVVKGAAREGVDVDVEATEIDEAFQTTGIVRGRTYRRRTLSGATGRTETEVVSETRRTTRDDVTTTVVDIIPPVPPVPPIPPVEPVTIVETNTVVQTRSVPEPLSIRVVSLEYDDETGRGTLVADIVRGSFREAVRHIRDHIADLAREGAGRERPPVVLPPQARYSVEAVSVNEDGLCEVAFTALPPPSPDAKAEGETP